MSASRVLTVRRPLVQPAGGRLLRVVRSWFVRRALLLGAALVLLCLLRVWQNHLVMRVAYDLSEAGSLARRLEHEQRELELELATLRDPRRLGEVARRKLGMTEPARGQVVVLP
jgi:cell division protein FtsL